MESPHIRSPLSRGCTIIPHSTGTGSGERDQTQDRHLKAKRIPGPFTWVCQGGPGPYDDGYRCSNWAMKVRFSLGIGLCQYHCGLAHEVDKGEAFQTRPFAGMIRIRFKGSLRCACQQYLSPLAGHPSASARIAKSRRQARAIFLEVASIVVAKFPKFRSGSPDRK